MKRVFIRENRYALMAAITTIFAFYLAVSSCIASDSGWVVLLYALLCWIGGFNSCTYVLPIIKSLITRHRSKSTT